MQTQLLCVLLCFSILKIKAQFGGVTSLLPIFDVKSQNYESGPLYFFKSYRTPNGYGYSSHSSSSQGSGQILNSDTHPLLDAFSRINNPFPSLPKIFQNNFHSNPIHFDLPQIRKMKTNQAKQRMREGFGGYTLIVSPGKTLIKRHGTLLECSGSVSLQFPFCNGDLRPFSIQTKQDFCYSNRYSEINGVFCIGQPEQKSLTFNNYNGEYSCQSSDGKPILLISKEDYQNLCKQMPWDSTYYFVSDGSGLFGDVLPNPDAGCTRSDYCVIKLEPKNQF